MDECGRDYFIYQCVCVQVIGIKSENAAFSIVTT